MILAQTAQKNTDDESTDRCDNDWCDSPDGETLPCFECFDSERNYDIGAQLTAESLAGEE